MRARIAAVAITAAALAVGLMPDAGADPSAVSTSGGRIACAGVRSLDIGVCVNNPLP